MFLFIFRWEFESKGAKILNIPKSMVTIWGSFSKSTGAIALLAPVLTTTCKKILDFMATPHQ